MSERTYPPTVQPFPVREVPRRTVVEFAAVEPGGTGRFNLCVPQPDGTVEVLVFGLARGVADRAADDLNRVLGMWVDACRIEIR